MFLMLALLAIIVPLVLLIVFRLPARTTMIISAIIVIAVAILAWQMTPLAVGASALQGIHRSLTIGLVLFGAIFLVKTMQGTGAMDRIKLGLHAISPDMRVQTVVVAFSFIALLEGMSGFGTPAIIAAPLLIILGFRPIAAAVLALLGDTMACTFGALAMPLTVGLENVPVYSQELSYLVGAQITLFDLVIAPLLSLGLVATLIFSFGNQSTRQKFKALREIAPWALFIGLVHACAAVIFVRTVGPELTSILAGAVSLIVAAVTAKLGWMTPRNIWRHHANPDHAAQDIPSAAAHIPLWRAWLPYGVAILLLLITRLIEPITNFLNSNLDASWHAILGIESISSTWSILYSPGVILILGAVAAAMIVKRPTKTLRASGLGALKATILALSALIPTLIMVQTFANSGINYSELASMPLYIAQTLANSFESLWLTVAPLLGAVGALIAGSATVSTLTMAPVQYSIAIDTGLPFLIVLALQIVGATAGNAIAIHNVVSVSTVVGLTHREGIIMRKLIVPTIIYLLVAGLIGALYLLLN